MSLSRQLSRGTFQPFFPGIRAFLNNLRKIRLKTDPVFGITMVKKPPEKESTPRLLQRPGPPWNQPWKPPINPYILSCFPAKAFLSPGNFSSIINPLFFQATSAIKGHNPTSSPLRAKPRACACAGAPEARWENCPNYFPACEDGPRCEKWECALGLDCSRLSRVLETRALVVGMESTNL